jgi:DNA-binding transcriptional MerR regulator
MTSDILLEIPVQAKKSPAALRTIGEVSELVGVPTHVLRFWETKFKKITPYKSNGRRYYKPSDIELIMKIKEMLYEKGYTIKGAQLALDFNTSDTQIQKTTPILYQDLNENNSVLDVEEIRKQLDSLKRALSKLQSALENNS